jgi:intein/homing endonuclease
MVVKANTIRLGDSLISGTGSIVLVTSVQVITGMFKVYELDVETNDTFIANGILTHNAKESLEPV